MSLPQPSRLRSKDGGQWLISIQALGPSCQLDKINRLTRVLTFTEISLEQRGNNVRVDIARVAFCEVIIDTLVELCTQAIDVGRPSTEPIAMEISFPSQTPRFYQRRT